MDESSESFQMEGFGEKSTRTLIVLGGDNLEQARSVEYYNADLNAWTELMDLDIDRTDFKSAMLGGMLILVGGNKNGTPTNTVQSYDFLSGKMTSLAPMNEPRVGHGLVVFSGHLFVIGGSNTTFLNSVERYDPITDTWTDMIPMPTARRYCGVTLHDADDEIYVLGGDNFNDLSVVESYNPLRGSWRKCASMNKNRHAPAVASIANFIYAAGGYDETSDIGVLNTVERYEPLTDRWTYIESMSEPRYGCEGVNYDDCMIVAGGYNRSEKISTVESYKNHQWSTIAPLVTGRGSFSLVDVPWSYIKQALKNKVS